jgi:transposase
LPFITGVSTATVHRVIATYNRLGPTAVESPGKGGRRHQYLMLPEEEQFLAPFFARAERGEIATVAQIRHAFEERVGHEVDASTIYRLLHRHGWRKLMPRSRRLKADLQIQEQFKRNFPVQVEAAIATRETGDKRPVLIMAQDEGCFGRISRAKRCWAPPRVRPHAPAQIIREYIYAYTAVAPTLGQMVSLILPEASTAMMNLFWEEVRQSFSNSFIIMQVDQAGWHCAKDLVIPENIRLIPQPAYSPELNPVEHIWDELREKYFYNRVFSSLELIIDTLCQGLNALAANAERLHSLTGFPHLNIII